MIRVNPAAQLCLCLALLVSWPIWVEGSGSGLHCQSCVELVADKTVFTLGETVPLALTLDAGQLPMTTVDAYLAAVQPSGRISFIRRMSSWHARDLSERMMLNISEDGGIGAYQLYFVIVPLGAEPTDRGNWLAWAHFEILVLPESWETPPDTERLCGPANLPRLIAHGGGQVASRSVTNSLQALDHASAAGLSVIELDLAWTRDQHLVLIHDWGPTYQRLFSRRSGVPNQVDFNNLSMNFGLTQLDFDQLVAWLSRHPDRYVITDIKGNHIRGLSYMAKRADHLARLIPQVHSNEELELASRLGFPNVILTLYGNRLTDAEILSLVRCHRLAAVAMSVSRVTNGSLARELAAEGVCVYAHSVNHLPLFDYLRTLGVVGIYSDRLTKLD